MNLTVLHTPFPRIKIKGKAAWAIVMAGLLTSVFILVFKPFGIQNETGEAWVNVIIAGFGLVFILSILLMELVLPAIFPSLFQNWTLKKAVGWYVVVIIVVAFNNYLYKSYWNDFEDFFGWSSFALVLWRTLGIGFVILFFLFGIREYLNRQRLSALLSNEDCLIKGENNESLKCRLEEILFVESDNNYVDIHLEKNGLRSKVVLRSSLKQIEKQLIRPISPIYKCHRSFLINSKHFDVVNANSRSMTIALKKYSDQIPVSKNYVRTVKEHLSLRPKNLSILTKTG